MEEIATATFHKTLTFKNEEFELTTKYAGPFKGTTQVLTKEEAYLFLKESGQLCQYHIDRYFKNLSL